MVYLRSTDGISWTGGTGPIYGNLTAVTYGPTGGYVAVGSFDGMISARSPDGQNWTARSKIGNEDVPTLKTSVTIDSIIDSVGSTGTPGQVLKVGPTGWDLAWSDTFAGPTGSILFSPSGTGPTGSTGLTYKEGPTGPVLTLKGDLIPSEHDVYSLGSTGTRWRELYVSTGSIHIGAATLSATGSAIIFNGDLIPATTNVFSVGNADSLLRSMHIGPGTVFIGPTGTLGNDDNGIMYSQYGFAAPTLALGASVPGATGLVEGGVRMTLTGSTGPIQYQHIGTGGVANGPVYTIMTTDTQNTGPTGPTGVIGIPGVSTGKILFLDSPSYAAPDLSGVLLSVPNTGTQTTVTATDQSGNDILVATFTTAAESTESTVLIGGLWTTNIFATASDDTSVTFYTNIYYVTADGATETLLSSGTATSATQIYSTPYIISYTNYVPDTVLPDLTYRYRIKIFMNFATTASATIRMRDSTNSHIHTTLVANAATGPTGPTGAPSTVTGPTGPSLSFQLGNNPYAAGGSLITTTIGTAQTRIYQVGPITTASSTKLLIMANASFISSNKQVSMTVGRATTSGATAANSTNIVSGTTPVTLPATTPSYYMAAISHGNNLKANVNGFAIDAPGAGTFYYTIWMSSSGSHNYSDMTAVLTALKIQS